MTVERTASLVFFTLLVGGLLISADQKIISSEAGQNVTLTCQAPNNSILVVEWKRADLDEYGLLYRDGRLYPANQHTSFKNRVELQDIELKHGDVSLILKNVMITDSGTYKCFVVMEIGNNNKSPIITINLNITDPPASDQQIFRQAGMSVNLTFLVPTGTTSVWLKRLEKYKDNEKYISYCKDLTPTHPSDQEESFKGRVEGMDCSNISGTVSVTLKNLTRNDSGTYEFHGVDHGGRYFNKTVFLNVTDPGHTGGGKNNGDSRGHLGLLVGPFVVLLVCVLVCVKCVKWLKNRSKKNSPFSSLPNNEADRKVEQSANNSVV